MKWKVTVISEDPWCGSDLFFEAEKVQLIAPSDLKDRFGNICGTAGDGLIIDGKTFMFSGGIKDLREAGKEKEDT